MLFLFLQRLSQTDENEGFDLGFSIDCEQFPERPLCLLIRFGF